MIDCSNCKHIYPHNIAWGEYWCKKFNKGIYSLHELRRRFRIKCVYYEDKNIKKWYEI